MKILRVITRLNLGGAARCVIHLARGLEAYGFETLVVTGSLEPGEGDMTDELLAAGGRLHFLPELKRSIDPVKDYQAYSKLRKLVKHYQPDIVHTHTAKAGFLGRLAAGRALKVHTFHGHVLEHYFGPLKSATFRKVEQHMASSTDALIAVSPSVRDELVERHGVGEKGRYRIIPSGRPELDLDGAQPLRDKGGGVVAGVMGRMVPVKGYEVLLEAVPALAEKVPGLKILMAGDGPLRSMVESYGRRAPWDRTLVPLGVRNDREAFFKSLDLLLLPSLQEGLPTVLLEAACAGVPVAASRIPGITDLFDDGKDALLFEAGSSEDLARAAVLLARDRVLRSRLAVSAREKVLKQVPSYAEVAGDHARLYREHLAKRGSAAVLTG